MCMCWDSFCYCITPKRFKPGEAYSQQDDSSVRSVVSSDPRYFMVYHVAYFGIHNDAIFIENGVDGPKSGHLYTLIGTPNKGYKMSHDGITVPENSREFDQKVLLGCIAENKLGKTVKMIEKTKVPPKQSKRDGSYLPPGTKMKTSTDWVHDVEDNLRGRGVLLPVTDERRGSSRAAGKRRAVSPASTDRSDVPPVSEMRQTPSLASHDTYDRRDIPSVSSVSSTRRDVSPVSHDTHGESDVSAASHESPVIASASNNRTSGSHEKVILSAPRKRDGSYETVILSPLNKRRSGSQASGNKKRPQKVLDDGHDIVDFAV